MNKQIPALTSLRGIAALVVVVLHFSYYILPQMGEILTSTTAFFRNGYLWVDFFFILSGFIMTHVYGQDFRFGVNLDSYRSYLFARIARIYPLHLFVLILFLALEIAKIYLFHVPAFTEKFNLTALFASVFLLQGFDLNCPPLFWCNTYWNEPAWSISTEFIIYCIFPFILFYLSKIKQKFNSITYLLTLLAILILIQCTRGNLDAIIGIPAIARCGLECILGTITYKVYQRGNYLNYVNLNLLAILSSAWMIAIAHIWVEKGRSLHDWLILPAFSLLILVVSNKNNSLESKFLNSRSLVYLGTISYSIYMVHWFLGELLKTIWVSKFHITFGDGFNQTQSWTALGIFISITLITASLTAKFVEIPIRNLIKPKIYLQP